MSRIKGIVNYSSNFEVRAQGPLDARMLVEFYTDLVDASTWEDTESLVWLYNGAIVVVKDDPSSGVYWLKDADNYTDYASWIPVGSEISLYMNKYTGTFDGTIDTSFGILASTHHLGTGPFNVTVFENNSLVYPGIDFNISGDITFYWTLGSLIDASCKFIISG